MSTSAITRMGVRMRASSSVRARARATERAPGQASYADWEATRYRHAQSTEARLRKPARSRCTVRRKWRYASTSPQPLKGTPLVAVPLDWQG